MTNELPVQDIIRSHRERLERNPSDYPMVVEGWRTDQPEAPVILILIAPDEPEKYRIADLAVYAAKMIAIGAEADYVVVTSDSYVCECKDKNNPETGKEWELGDMADMVKRGVGKQYGVWDAICCTIVRREDQAINLHGDCYETVDGKVNWIEPFAEDIDVSEWEPTSAHSTGTIPSGLREAMLEPLLPALADMEGIKCSDFGFDDRTPALTRRRLLHQMLACVRHIFESSKKTGDPSLMVPIIRALDEEENEIIKHSMSRQGYNAIRLGTESVN